MIEVRVSDPVPGATGYAKRTLTFERGGRSRGFHVLVPEAVHPLTADWAVLPAILHGMRQGEPVRIHGTVSPTLATGEKRIPSFAPAIVTGSGGVGITCSW